MDSLAFILPLPAFCLLLFLALPASRANQFAGWVRRWVAGVAAFQLVVAAVAFVSRLGSSLDAEAITLLEGPAGAGWSLSLYYDGASSLMLLLVSFVGWVICRFSVRYLDGEEQQGNFFRWVAVAVGAVSLMAISGNLLMFAAAWVMTSFALHHLLLYYPERPAARRAAWTKFAISRAGDVALVSAIVLTYVRFNTLEFGALFAQLSEMNAVETGSQVPMPLIGWLLVAAAALKSAQFPFHSWLPLTMETPTPVSALMHAGIVNAGGYLLIRTSPLVVHAPNAMIALAIIGGVTAIYGAVVMMTQSSVKQALAYSTVAQMGFMMLQCGLGAFTAAMLHVIAHSLYKAHAFLNSGSVVAQTRSTKGARPIGSASPVGDGRAVSAAKGQARFLLMAVATLAIYVTVSSLMGFDFAKKPGAFVFSLTLCLALMTWGWRIAMLGDRQTILGGLLGVAGLCVVYMLGYLGINAVIADAIPAVELPAAVILVNAAIALVFCVLLGLHVTLVSRRVPQWLASIRVHAASGFYIDAIYRRLARAMAS